MGRTDSSTIAAGSIVVVRDEEWLVTAAECVEEVWRVEARGLGEAVRNSQAVFFGDIDDIEVLDPRQAKLVADTSSQYRRTRLWLEATLRKTPVPLDDERLTVTQSMLVDPLVYQRQAVVRALSTDNLRPRLLIADAVGLGKTLEIGMILSELARRGRAERILVICPRHVLGQMQQELWTRFALPLVRLDSDGIRRIRQTLPASRNPFTFYSRVVVSIDTIKSPEYRAYLESQRWDAVVIDESHNVTNRLTLKSELARVVAPNTEALILASATPHNGNPDSFAELLRLLDPTIVAPDGTFEPDDAKRVLLRRHRNSPDVANEVGAKWAERQPPKVIGVPASPGEDAVATELAEVWLHPTSGRSPHSGRAGDLFGWTLAKAFLSSPAAFGETVRNRRKRVETDTDRGAAEAAALDRLADLVNEQDDSTKLTALVEHLKEIGITGKGDTRVVVFSEWLTTLEWLAEALPAALGMDRRQFAVLHARLPEQEQERIIEQFKLDRTPLRVLLASDMASEGVNLHARCHQLVHFDLPWSLIRIEQRNGRIDRYGQTHPPQITALALMPSHDRFSGDVRVLRRLLDKEHEAHTALGDAGSLMGTHDADLEEGAIRAMLASGGSLDTTVPSVDERMQDELAAMDQLFGEAGQVEAAVPAVDNDGGLFDTDLEFLRSALSELYEQPDNPPDAGDSPGVGWQAHDSRGLVELTPPRDLRFRLSALPQSYLRDRHVERNMVLATTPAQGNAQLAEARKMGSTTWPEAHYLSPLHPVLDWVADKILSDLGRNEVYLVAGTVAHPTVVVLGTLTNRRGQVVARQFITVAFPTGDPGLAMPTTEEGLGFLDATGLRGGVNRGTLAATSALQALVPAAVDAAYRDLELTFDTRGEHLQQRLDAALQNVARWKERAEQLHLAGTRPRRDAQSQVDEQQAAIESLAAEQPLARPLVVVVPEEP